MKFVFFGYDFSLDVAKRLIKDGHEMIGCFTFYCDNVFNFNKDLITLAEKLDIPLSQEKPTPDDIQNFTNQGCDVFLVCGYPNKIPPIDESKAYGLNTHPTLLPKGRGLMPSPYIIMHAPEAAGFTVHKLTPKYDTGAIIYQEAIALDDSTTVDSYSGAIAKRTPEAISNIFSDLPGHWNAATPQDENQASAFPAPDDKMRTIKWDDPIEQTDIRLRAFGSYGTLAYINGKLYAIFAHEWEKEEHDFDPGTVTEATDKHIKIAAQGGFVTATKFSAL